MLQSNTLLKCLLRACQGDQKFLILLVIYDQNIYNTLIKILIISKLPNNVACHIEACVIWVPWKNRWCSPSLLGSETFMRWLVQEGNSESKIYAMVDKNFNLGQHVQIEWSHDNHRDRQYETSFYMHMCISIYG